MNYAYIKPDQINQTTQSGQNCKLPLGNLIFQLILNYQISNYLSLLAAVVAISGTSPPKELPLNGGICFISKLFMLKLFLSGVECPTPLTGSRVSVTEVSSAPSQSSSMSVCSPSSSEMGNCYLKKKNYQLHYQLLLY